MGYWSHNSVNCLVKPYQMSRNLIFSMDAGCAIRIDHTCAIPLITVVVPGLEPWWGVSHFPP